MKIIKKEFKIKMIEEALAKDLKEKAKNKRNIKSIKKLQDIEKELSKELTKVQDKILKKLELRFDYSDDITLDSMRKVLLKLKKK